MNRSGSAIPEGRWQVEILSPGERPADGVIDLFPAFDPPGAGRARPVRQRRGPIPLWLWLAAATAAMLVALLVFRDSIADAVPPAADAYQAIGLPAAPSTPAIGEIDTIRIYGRGGVSLAIEGEIVNETGRQAALRSIEFALLNAGGATIASWSIEPARPILAPGGRTRFATEAATLPDAARSIAVTIGGEARAIVPID